MAKYVGGVSPGLRLSLSVSVAPRAVVIVLSFLLLHEDRSFVYLDHNFSPSNLHSTWNVIVIQYVFVNE